MLQPARLEQLRRTASTAAAQNLSAVSWPAATVLALLDHIAELEAQAEAQRCRCLGKH